MMVFLYITLIILVCSLIALNIYRLRFLNDARRRGKLPKKGRATMFDVRHLLMEGEKELATQIYCEIFSVNLTKAKKDVEELQRSLKV
jgi:hypothetical protein